MDEEVEGCLARREEESVGMDELERVRVDLANAGRFCSRFSGSGGGGDEPAAVGTAGRIFGGDMSAVAAPTG